MPAKKIIWTDFVEIITDDEARLEKESIFEWARTQAEQILDTICKDQTEGLISETYFNVELQMQMKLKTVDWFRNYAKKKIMELLEKKQAS